MLKTTLLPIVIRYGLTIIGGILVGKGIFTEAGWGEISNTIITLLGTVLSAGALGTAVVVNKDTVKVPVDSKAAAVARTESRERSDNG